MNCGFRDGFLQVVAKQGAVGEVRERVDAVDSPGVLLAVLEFNGE